MTCSTMFLVPIVWHLDASVVLVVHDGDDDRPDEPDHRPGHQQHAGDATERRRKPTRQRSRSAVSSRNAFASKHLFS
jgi:hypothetical protein